MAYTGATTGFAAGAETNTSAVDYALETLYNQPPTGAYQALRYTDCSLAVNETETQPDEINDIPEMAQSVLTGRTTQGSISGILSVGTFEDMLAGVMGSDFSTNKIFGSADGKSGFSYIKSNSYTSNSPNINGNDDTAKNAINSLPDSGYIYIHDPVFGIDDYFQYYKTGSNGIMIIQQTGAFDSYISADSAPAGVNAFFKVPDIINGKIGKSWTFRKYLSQKWELYSGTMVNQVQISLQKGQPATISIDLAGSDMTMSAKDIASSVMPRTASPLINTVEGFLGCKIFGNAPSGCIQSATITLSRDGSGQDTGMGHVGACGIRFGSFKLAMEITYLFRDYQQFIDWQAGKTGPVSVRVQGSDGQGYIFVGFNGVIRNPKTPISGKNQTVVATVSITANPLASGGTFGIFRTGS